MRFFLFIELLLISFICVAGESAVIKGEFRLGLPKQFSSAQVLFVLRPAGASLDAGLAFQTVILKDGQKVPINLEYDIAKFSLDKQYKIDVFVRELLTEDQRLISKDSFLLNSLNKLYIAIQIPPDLLNN